MCRHVWIATAAVVTIITSVHAQTQTAAQHAREVGRLVIKNAMVIPGTGVPAYGPGDLLIER